MKSVHKLLNPKNIAVVGVSSDPNKIGSIIFNNIINSGFKGRVYPINPKHKELYGFKVFEAAEKIKHRVDLGIIAVPGPFVMDILKKAKDSVRNWIIISAGFSEVNEKGIETEKEIADFAEKYNVNILGPNCLGIINPLLSLNASFSAQSAAKGNIAFVSQSGALCTMMLDLAANINLGFAHFVSLGNKADINEHDFIKYWDSLDEVSAIFAYLEEIEDGDKFYKLARDLSKPLVILTPGKSDYAKEAISSHTGSVATPNTIIKAAIEQSNTISVETPYEMFSAMVAYSWGKPLDGNNIAVVTNAGGPGVISTDLLSDASFELAEISDETIKKLKKFLPAEAGLNNPIDILGTAKAEDYINTINTVIEEDSIDAIMVVVTPQLITQIEDTAKLLIPLIRDSKKPIIPVFLGGKYSQTGLIRLFDNKLAGFDSLEKGIFALQVLQKTKKIPHEKLKVKMGSGKHQNEVNKSTKDEPSAIKFELIEKMIQEFDIKLPNQKIVYDINELEEFIEQSEYPLVLKALPEDILHKTDVKALYLNIQKDVELFNNYTRLKATLEKQNKINNPGILVQEQIIGGQELFLGVKRDGTSEVYDDESKGFGHMMVFGKGGIYTEIYKDFSYGLIPMTGDDIKHLISNTKVSEILKGARGEEGYPAEKLYDFISKIQDLITDYPQIYEMDLNPLIITHDNVWPVDIKIITKS